jgi:tRNA pseudouridine38-40 synthase
VSAPPRVPRPAAHCWKLVVEYDGTRYGGWQEQRNATTVQGVLRSAAEKVFEERVEIGAAGRTDAGVHALGQVAHLRTTRPMAAKALFYGLNDALPPDVNLLRIDPAAVSFHARHQALERSYLYQISTRRTAFGKRFVWWVKDSLDESAMATAASLFEGRHDFESFCDRDDPKDSTLVHVRESRIVGAGDLLLYRVAASHFLWKMVRRMVGTLVAVGRGQLTPAEVSTLLRTPSRVPAPLTAPPSGLFLEQVRYIADEPQRELVPAFPVE